MVTIQNYPRRRGRMAHRWDELIQWGTQNNYVKFGARKGIFQTIMRMVLDSTPLACIEIGYGYGENLLASAKHHPSKLHIGIDLYLPGMVSCLKNIKSENIDNVLLIVCEANQIIYNLPPHVTERVNVHFPDPWPKNKHRKRRLVDGDFIERLRLICKPKGMIHFASDDQEYYASTLKVAGATSYFPKQLKEKYIPRQPSKFSKRAKEAKRPSMDWYIIS